mgnify:CR=1 FL=1
MKLSWQMGFPRQVSTLARRQSPVMEQLLALLKDVQCARLELTLARVQVGLLGTELW